MPRSHRSNDPSAAGDSRRSSSMQRALTLSSSQMRTVTLSRHLSSSFRTSPIVPQSTMKAGLRSNPPQHVPNPSPPPIRRRWVIRGWRVEPTFSILISITAPLVRSSRFEGCILAERRGAIKGTPDISCPPFRARWPSTAVHNRYFLHTAVAGDGIMDRGAHGWRTHKSSAVARSLLGLRATSNGRCSAYVYQSEDVRVTRCGLHRDPHGTRLRVHGLEPPSLA
jgi:hypothetical protein